MDKRPAPSIVSGGRSQAGRCDWRRQARTTRFQRPKAPACAWPLRAETADDKNRAGEEGNNPGRRPEHHAITSLLERTPQGEVPLEHLWPRRRLSFDTCLVQTASLRCADAKPSRGGLLLSPTSASQATYRSGGRRWSVLPLTAGGLIRVRRRFTSSSNQLFSLRPKPSAMPCQAHLHPQLLLQPVGGQMLCDVERLALAAGGGELDRPTSRATFRAAAFNTALRFPIPISAAPIARPDLLRLRPDCVRDALDMGEETRSAPSYRRTSTPHRAARYR